MSLLGIDPRNEGEFDAHPTLDIEYDAGPSVQAELKGMGILEEVQPPKLGRKAKRKAKREQSLRDIAEQLTQPQYIMRDEILNNHHHVKDEDVLTPFGRFDRDVPGLAAEICDRASMNLGRGQWIIVQELVEEALRVGFAAAQGGRG